MPLKALWNSGEVWAEAVGVFGRALKRLLIAATRKNIWQLSGLSAPRALFQRKALPAARTSQGVPELGSSGGCHRGVYPCVADSAAARRLSLTHDSW